LDAGILAGAQREDKRHYYQLTDCNFSDIAVPPSRPLKHFEGQRLLLSDTGVCVYMFP
jgi:hypothetical protein